MGTRPARALAPLAAALAGAVLLCGPLRADRELEKVAEQARQTRELVARLSTKMESVAQKLDKTHPYYAQKLREAVKRMQGALLREDYDQFVKLLEEFKQGDALAKGQEITTDLERLLAFLEDRPDAEKTRKELENIRKALDELAKINKEHQDNTKQLQDMNAGRNQQLERLGEQIRQLE